MKSLRWWDQNLELVILAVMLAVMSVLSFANVIMRYVFHNALSWSDEICCYCLALSAFFALPCAVRLGVSIKVDTFTLLMPTKVQKWMKIACAAGMIVLLIWLLHGTVEIINNAQNINQASPALRIPVALLYRFMACGIILGIIRYIQWIVKEIFKSKKKE